jgi:putative addiction module killer protein
MIEVRRTDEFKTWLDGLKDRKARTIIATRIARIEAGLVGDVRRFNGIAEIKIDFGPGYRLYFRQRGKVVVILLCGGDKKTQKRDIATAIELAKEYE